MSQNKKISIFTDGASKGNPGPGGWGAVVAHSGEITELGGSELKTTNNRMELVAVIEALSYVKEQTGEVVVHSDSAYVVNGITKWVHGWKQNGWLTKQKEEVLNRDLWERLDDIVSKRMISWKRVAGHADTPGNTRADEIASAYGDGDKSHLYSGSQDRYPINLSVVGRMEGGRSGGKVYSYVSLVGGVVQTHKTWKECEARVKGKEAKFRKVFSAEEEIALIEEFSK